MSDFAGLDTLDYSFVDEDSNFEHSAILPEQSLWCAVINVALADAADGCDIARDWLLCEKDDFIYVCTLAGVSPFSVRNAARRLTAQEKL